MAKIHNVNVIKRENLILEPWKLNPFEDQPRVTEPPRKIKTAELAAAFGGLLRPATPEELAWFDNEKKDE